MRVVAISDTHGLHDYVKVPDGDLLIHAGDCTGHGTLTEIKAFNHWLGKLPHKHKVMIAGNHDFDFQLKTELARKLITNAIYLQDQQCIIEDFCIYGSPWQPEFHNWAFNAPRGPSIRKIWQKIPTEVDILVTHGPPNGILDKNWKWDKQTKQWDKENGEHCGCEELGLHIWNNLSPLVHVFGHIHEGYGERVMPGIGVKFVNASICTRGMEPTNPPIVFDL